MFEPMTGTIALQLIKTCEAAVDKAGGGEMRGLKLLNALIDARVELRLLPPEPVVAREPLVASSDLEHG